VIAIELPRHGLSDGYDYRNVPLRAHAVSLVPFLTARRAEAQLVLSRAARLESVPGRHVPWLDDTDQCASALTAFLNDASRGRSPTSIIRKSP
jgi:hypothetical protein